jgi:hypothetical protein
MVGIANSLIFGTLLGVSNTTYLKMHLRLLVSINSSISQMALLVDAPRRAHSLMVMLSVVGRLVLIFIFSITWLRTILSLM